MVKQVRMKFAFQKVTHFAYILKLENIITRSIRRETLIYFQI